MERKLLCGVSIIWVLVLYCAMPCFAMAPRPEPINYQGGVIAKAEVDECFNGLGGDYVPGANCAQNEIEKTNQSYLWGLTKADDALWFGTGANMVCLVWAFNSYNTGTDINAYQNDLWACEYDRGKYLESELDFEVPAVFNDYRPPKIYSFDITTETLTDRSEEITNPLAYMLLQMTLGLRSAANYGGYVFLSGPMALGKGINMFVFNASTGAFVGAGTLSDYQNIRKWLVYDNVLYAAVGDEYGGGKVLRWTGTMTAPLSFEEVGVLDGVGAEIAVHDGRIFVGTWPSRVVDDPALAGIYMSPVIPSGGLTTDHADQWEKVWQADEYEPDPFGVKLYGVGAMHSFGDYLYWGTMHVQGGAAISYINEYNISQWGYLDAYYNSMRATALFRGKDFGDNKSIELLYGDSYLPVYSSGRWHNSQNKMGGVSGKYGSSGFGNEYNNYTWTMAVYKDKLYVGTMDHSYLWKDWRNLQSSALGFNIYLPWWMDSDDSEFGADLWRFDNTSSAAKRISRDGLDNYTNYGFRSIVADDETGLYLGTANPANLYHGSNGKRGGWELIRYVEE